MTNTQIANYTLLQVLGTGGMGTVYLAENQNIGSKVAIKMLHPHLIKSEPLKVRFLKEAKTQAILSHPNITKVIDFVANEKGVFIILEYIEGVPLDEYLFRKKGLMPEKEANQYFAKILDAVGYAHSKGVIHRDLKCANIMITPHQDIKIMDFGIAKMAGENLSLTKTGSRMGSPLYMSPEQVTSGQVDLRSDIYALGVVYHEMLTGKPVYNQHTTTEYEIYDKIVKEPLPRLKEIYGMVTDHAQAVVDIATAKLPKKRFQNCSEFKHKLLNTSEVGQRIVPNLTVSSTEKWQTIKNSLERPGKDSKNNKNILIVAILLIAIVLMGGGIFYYENNSSRTQNGSAEIKIANDFAKEGSYKDAYAEYQNIILAYPENSVAKERLAQLKTKSEAFQKRSADSVLQLYLQTSSLENFNPNNSSLGFKISNNFALIYNELNRVKLNQKVVGNTDVLNGALTNLTRAHQSFKPFDFAEKDNSELLVAARDSILKINERSDNAVSSSEKEEIVLVKENRRIGFDHVQTPPVYPGCDYAKPVLQRDCFRYRIAMYISKRIKAENYEYLDLKPGFQNCDYSFSIATDGSLKNVKVNAPHPQIEKELRFALELLQEIKPGFQNNVPVEVFYGGRHTFNISMHELKQETQTKKPITKTQNTPQENRHIEKKTTRFDILEKAAKNGNPQSQYDLAQMYFAGTEIPQDKNKAFYWYKKSAENGFVNAQEEMGAVYYQNEDFNNAFIWYSKAANANHSRAQYVLGYMYMKGLSVKKSRRNAKSWWKKSCDLGYYNSCEEIKKMNAVLNTVKESIINYTPKN